MSRRALARLGRGLVRADPLTAADAVVVLGGAPSARCPEAARLLALGWAPRVVCVGGRGAPPGEARRSVDALARLGVTGDRVVVAARPAPGTAEEARVVVELAADRGWGRLLVVTSAYHTFRAGRLFDRRAAAAGLHIRMVVARDDRYDPEAWWRDARQRRLVRNEVLKHAAWLATLRRR